MVKPWQSWVLKAAGIYNVLWGALVVLAPVWTMSMLGGDTAPGLWLPLWQCVGMIVGVYGVGYWVAAKDPLRHWPIVLVGLLGKIFGPIGFLQGVMSGAVPPTFGLTILPNDLIWWVPFSMILWDAASAAQQRFGRTGNDAAEGPVLTPEEAMAKVTDQQGVSLKALSEAGPVLVVFLRHMGCTFCREALTDICGKRAKIEASGTRIALVHMGDDASAAAAFTGYGLGDVARLSDPERTLYRAFGLTRGSIGQLFGWKVFLRGVAAGAPRLLGGGGHGVGALAGDGFQMPGAFVVLKGKVVRAFRHETAGERPDYESFACAIGAGR